MLSPISPQFVCLIFNGIFPLLFLVPEYYKSDKSSLIAIFNALAAYYIRQARQSTEKAKIQQHFTQATQLFHKADSLDIHEEITWVGKGILLLFRRELVQSRKQFQTVLDKNDQNIPALLGQACIYYHDAKYVEACNIYRKVIRMHPGCPASVRIGLANCFHKLNKPDLARQVRTNPNRFCFSPDGACPFLLPRHLTTIFC